VYFNQAIILLASELIKVCQSRRGGCLCAHLFSVY